MVQDERYNELRRILTESRLKTSQTQSEVAFRLGKPQSFVSKYENGERTLDLVEFLDVCEALSCNAEWLLRAFVSHTASQQTIFDKWEISEADVSHLIRENPSLRGMLFGYVAERKFHELFLNHPEVVDAKKDDDHDRTKKGDRRIMYKGKSLTIEVKSLQTKTVQRREDGTWRGKAQVDASDKRTITFPDKTTLDTTLLLRGEFHLLAVNCFAFGQGWRFAFAKNSDLPRSTWATYTDIQREQLIASLIEVTWPPQPPFTVDPFKLLDELLGESQTVSVTESLLVAERKETIVKVQKI